MTIKCPRLYCGGRITIEPFISDQGFIVGYEARCLLCSRDFTDHLKRTPQTEAA